MCQRIPSAVHLLYNDHFAYLGLQCLETRRLRSDLLFLFKPKFGFTLLTLVDFSLNTFRLRINRFISSIYSFFAGLNFFISRSIRIWNAFNKNVTNAIHYLQFRRYIYHYRLILQLICGGIHDGTYVLFAACYLLHK